MKRTCLKNNEMRVAMSGEAKRTSKEYPDFFSADISRGNWEDVVERLLNQERAHMKPGLERMKRLLQELGNPEQNFKSVLIAGTNGKGSTTHYLYNILLGSGVSAGCYVSPHLLRFHERISVNGHAIRDVEIVEGLSQIQLAMRRMVEHERSEMPSPFEIFTALAFWYFARRNVELAAVEVGLGGRLDASNVLTPLCSIITSIGLEHQDFLGDTLEEIAREKAGIINDGVPVFTAVMGQGLGVIKKEAERRCAQLHIITENELPGFELASFGRHQQLNAALAVSAANYLNEQGIITLPERRIWKALKATRLPGRLEYKAIPGAKKERLKMLVDVAHNPSAAEAVAGYVKDVYVNTAEKWHISLVAGFLRDKDFVGFLRHFSFACEITLVRNSSSRSWTEEQIEETLEGMRERGKSIVFNSDQTAVFDELLSGARNKSSPSQKRVVLITGSHHTVRDFLEYVNERKNA